MESFQEVDREPQMRVAITSTSIDTQPAFYLLLLDGGVEHLLAIQNLLGIVQRFAQQLSLVGLLANVLNQSFHLLMLPLGEFLCLPEKREQKENVNEHMTLYCLLYC